MPSRTLYPHQWSWDSAFIAIGLAQVRPAAPGGSWRACSGRSGPTDGCRTSCSTRRCGSARTSRGRRCGAPPSARSAGGGHLRPRPAAGARARRVLAYRRAPDPTGLAALRRLYPALVAQQRYLADRRDVAGDGLVCIVHPWESGLDNSPAWDEPMAAVPAEAAVMSAYRRHDTAHADAAHRPTDLDYARYLAIVAAYRDHDYSDRDLATGHPFLVECPLFNAAFGAAEHALAEIAALVGADPGPHRARAARITEALLRRLYDTDTGTFQPRDLRTDRLVSARTVLGLTPLILPDLPPREVDALVVEARSARFGVAGGWTGRCPPTTAPRPTSSRCVTGGGRAGSTSAGWSGVGCSCTGTRSWPPGCATR